MSTLLIALAALQAAPAAQPATPPAAAAPAARTLKDLPNVSLSYYDVTGKDMKAINKSIAKARSKAGTTSKDPVAYNWDVGAQIRTRTTDGVCAITGVEPTFKAKVELPRLTNENTVIPAVLDGWRDYQASNLSFVTQKLWFVYERLPAIAAPLAGKKCDQAQKDWDAAIAKLKADAIAFKPVVATKAATASSAARDPVKPNDD